MPIVRPDGSRPRDWFWKDPDGNVIMQAYITESPYVEDRDRTVTMSWEEIAELRKAMEEQFPRPVPAPAPAPRVEPLRLIRPVTPYEPSGRETLGLWPVPRSTLWP